MNRSRPPVFVVAALVLLAVGACAQGEIRPPLSGLVAVSVCDAGAADVPALVRGLVARHRRGEIGPSEQFPLAAATSDAVRTLRGLRANVVVRWLDPITWSRAADAPRFGANPDFVAYFGDGWDATPGAAPSFRGRDDAGWIWVNHEYVSNDAPTRTTAATGQHLTLARDLKARGLLTNDVESQLWTQDALDRYVHWYKREVGGSWLRIVRDPATGAWHLDRQAANRRYDATSGTRLTLTGRTLDGRDHDDLTGEPLPPQVVSGIMGDCSGGQTPWGTIITAEENVQDYYGDLETAWDANNRFVSGAGFDAGARITFPVESSTADTARFGRSHDPHARHRRDLYGYLAEIDPGEPAERAYHSLSDQGDGRGHRKLGALGRARWENATIAVDAKWQLLPDRPVVVYAGNDRRSGRVYKFVSTGGPSGGIYRRGMSRAAIRALLDTGRTYVAHFAGLDNATGYTLDGGELPREGRRGTGRWIELSTTSEDLAPNAAALGAEETTVGTALTDDRWNGIGGFADDDAVRAALFTAANKIGVMELNRPEDLEWNPRDPSGTPRLYVAFTNHTVPTALDQHGVRHDPETHALRSPPRSDREGSIFVMEEADPADPAHSGTFTYFAAWRGSLGRGAFDATCPDNLLLDREGGVWFGTDGNFATNGTADALYYLDVDPAHRDGAHPTFGLAFRVVAGPSDAEATGPAFSSGMGTLFFNVQHPGEFVDSTWPHAR